MLELAPSPAHYGDLATRLARGERVPRAEALALATAPDVFALGQLAAQVKRRLHADRAFCSLTQLATFTDARFTLRGQPVADQQRRPLVPRITAVVAAPVERRAQEWHLLVGEDAGLPFTAYLDQITALRQQYPTAYIQGFTADDVALMADIYHLPVADLLVRLRNVGLNALDGGDALICAPRVRATVATDVIPWARWRAVHATAHHLGLSSSATMRCSAVETWAERVDHLLALRAMQADTGSFDRFVLLVDSARRAPASALDDLKAVAISRLVLDNIPHIVADTASLGVEVAQTALTWGADTLAGASAPTPGTDLAIVAHALQAQIRGTGCQPLPFHRAVALLDVAR